MIRINNLSLIKTKKAVRKTLLQDISLDIITERVTLLLGKSGSGKTSILRCLAQIEKNYWGEILCCGKKLDQIPQKERCQLIGFVPQSYALFPFMTVLDNCAHPLRMVLGFSKKEAYKKVEELVPTLEMQNLLHAYPHELSGGQQQRASILRALLLNPMFLLMDEPTSALDPENTNLLVRILSRLKKEGKGIVIASQDMLFAQKVFENVYFLEHGKITQHYDVNSHPSLQKQSQLGKFLCPEEEQTSFSTKAFALSVH
jgi:ABC-type polar amino acid transport system ATPase subunit